MSDSAVTANETLNTPAQTEIASSDAELGAIYDRLVAENVETESGTDTSDTAVSESTRDEKGRFAKSTPAEASPQEGEAGGEEAKTSLSERQAAPASLPATWRQDMSDIWGSLSQEHRDRLGSWSQENYAKLSDMGRKISSYSDVQSVLDDMVQTYPDRFGQNGMKPTEAVKYLYQVQKDMDANPVETILQIAQRYEALPELAKRLGMNTDGAQVQSLQGTIQELKSQLANMLSPDSINKQVSRALTERETLAGVQKFAAEKPFYSEVEDDLPAFIEIAKGKMQDANALEVLAEAYDMAVNAIPNVRQKVQAASKVASATDSRANAAKRAASINVKSTAGSKPRPRTDEEAMGEVWDRHKMAL